MDLDPEDATLLSNRSLCWLRMGDAEKALQDAVECKEMRPDWPKACYRLGAALLLLKVGWKILSIVLLSTHVFDNSLHTVSSGLQEGL